MKKFIVPFLIIFISFIVGITIGFLTKNNSAQKDNDDEITLQLVKIPYVTEEANFNEIIKLYNTDYQKVPKDLVNDEILTDLDELYNSNEFFCAKNDGFVPQNSFLYKNQIAPCSETGYVFNNLESYYYPFLLEVSSSDRDIIKDDSYVDIKIKAIYKGKLINNVLIENVNVIKRYDEKGNVINDDTTPTYEVLVGLPNEYHMILQEAKISNYTSNS